jgi:hypothetical protein
MVCERRIAFAGEHYGNFEIDVKQEMGSLCSTNHMEAAPMQMRSPPPGFSDEGIRTAEQFLHCRHACSTKRMYK